MIMFELQVGWMI